MNAKAAMAAELPVHREPAKNFIDENFHKYLVDFNYLVQLIRKTKGKENPSLKKRQQNFCHRYNSNFDRPKDI